MDNAYMDKMKSQLKLMRAKWTEMSANVESKVADAKMEADKQQKKLEWERTMNEWEAELNKGADAAQDKMDELSHRAQAWMDELSNNNKSA